MYITGKGRYDLYTTRSSVYLFTLRDYAETLLDNFGGRQIDRKDMVEKSGYLLEFVDFAKAKAFISGIATSSSTSGEVTTFVLPSLEGNELPLYATTSEFTPVVYIGLAAYPEELDDFKAKVVTLTFDVNGGTGTVPAAVIVEPGTEVTAPSGEGLEGPDDKVFASWNTKADGTGTTYVAETDFIKVDEDMTVYAIYEEA